MCHQAGPLSPLLITVLPVTWKARRLPPVPAFSPCAGTAGTEASGSSQTVLSYSSPPGSLVVVTGLQACEAGAEGTRITSRP